MKRYFQVLLLGAMAGSVCLSGCSKSEKTPAAGANRADVSAVSAKADGPVEMRIKWTTGKKYSMRMEFKQGTETPLPNQPQPLKGEVNLAQDFTISALKSTDNGGQELELEFETETMDVSQGGNLVVSFDSTKNPAPDANNPAAGILRAMIGARIQYYCDANGKVEKVGGVDELMKRIAAVGKPQEQAMFKQMFSEDTLKQYGDFGDMMPNRMIKVGESWPVNRDVVSPVGVLAVNVIYTFKNWEQRGDRKCAHITAAGEISSKTTSNASGAVVEIKKGKTSGDVWFDPELGMVVDVNSDQTMGLKVTTRTDTMTPQLSQKIRVTLLDVE